MGKNYNLGAWSGFKLVDILMVFLKEYLENITFEIKSADNKKACKISQQCKKLEPLYPSEMTIFLLSQIINILYISAKQYVCFLQVHSIQILLKWYGSIQCIQKVTQDSKLILCARKMSWEIKLNHSHAA